jgi:PLP dependent protein
MGIKENLNSIKKTINNPACNLIAVSKTQSIEAIMEAYEAGQRDFGENKVQEMSDKQAALPKDIRWHMIGHLQTNKVKYLIPYVNLIHGVDSFKLLLEINKQAEKSDTLINCLLQVHIAQETHKFGFDETELETLMKGGDLSKLKNIQIKGLMGMATYSDDGEVIRKEFKFLKSLRDKLALTILPDNVSLNELSMGMSGDYLIAIEEGSTLVRIGSAIFGERNYTK